MYAAFLLSLRSSPFFFFSFFPSDPPNDAPALLRPQVFCFCELFGQGVASAPLSSYNRIDGTTEVCYMNIPLSDSTTATLIGLGRSNLAAADFLTRRHVRFTVRDRRPLSALGEGAQALAARGVVFFGGDFYLDHLSENLILLSPGIRPDLPPLAAAVARGAVLTNEVALFSAFSPALLLGVTGSDGKTTTTTIAGRLLSDAWAAKGRQVFVGGNIGRPLIGMLPKMREQDFAVAELSSFQLMSMDRAAMPARAVITNITENHLNWHTDMAEYIAAKHRILAPHTHAILNADDPILRSTAASCRSLTLFSAQQDRRALCALRQDCHTMTVESGYICADGHPIGPVSSILLPGRHNLENYLAALGLVFPFLPDPCEAFAHVAASFRGVPHRLELVGECNGVRYYNSSIDSTPSRTAASLDALGGRPIVLCGGADKGLSPAPLRDALSRHARAVILFGAARSRLADALQDCNLIVKIRVTMEEALHTAVAMAKPGETVVLSPACTSFDAFRDYEERGERFRTLVHALTSHRDSGDGTAPGSQ